MDTPRCGVPDTVELEGEEKWAPWTTLGWRPNHALTYRVVGLPSSMGSFGSSAEILQYIQIAFDNWSNRTTLTFTRTTSSSADIDITFKNDSRWASTNGVGDITVDLGGGTTTDPTNPWDKWPETTGVDFSAR